MSSSLARRLPLLAYSAFDPNLDFFSSSTSSIFLKALTSVSNRLLVLLPAAGFPVCRYCILLRKCLLSGGSLLFLLCIIVERECLLRLGSGLR